MKYSYSNSLSTGSKGQQLTKALMLYHVFALLLVTWPQGSAVEARGVAIGRRSILQSLQQSGSSNSGTSGNSSNSSCGWQRSPNLLPVLNSTALVGLKVERRAYDEVTSGGKVPSMQPPLGTGEFRRLVADLALSPAVTRLGGSRIVTTQATSGTSALQVSEKMLFQ